MLILFPKRNGVKIATTLIFEAIEEKKGFNYVSGMIDFAYSIKAITDAERAALLQYLIESYD